MLSLDVSRTTYYFAKLLLTWGLGIAIIAISTYLGCFGNIIFNAPSHYSSFLDITIIMLRQLPIFCGIMSVLVMIAAITQKTSRYNAIAIGHGSYWTDRNKDIVNRNFNRNWIDHRFKYDRSNVF